VETQQIYAKLNEVFRDVFEDEITVVPELSAKDVDEWDSLTHLRLMLTVEKTFKVKFSAAEVGHLSNVGELVKVIHSKL
jgi:acyl carrier protein